MSANKKSNYTTVRKLKRRTGSSTPGKAKGDNCKKSPLKVQYAKDTRMHKTSPVQWMQAIEEIVKVQRQKGMMNPLQELC
jgi:hypothetical protein